MNKIRLKEILSLILVLIGMVSCSLWESDPLEKALRAAGTNRLQLEAVLKHYEGDSLKQEAARFLIENMLYHSFEEGYFISSDGKKYRPDLSIYNDPDKMSNCCDSLMTQRYGVKRNRGKDITTLDSTFLIRNIDLAFAVWQKPWAKEVSFMDFCRYILPYRSSEEMPSSLRKEIMERFLPVLDSAQVTTPLEACKVLNGRLKAVIRYSKTGLPFYPTIDETYRAGYSQCEGMCDLGAYIMRACGIPVAVDQTTWVKMDLGHRWCAVLVDGHFQSFGPGEDQPGVHAQKFAEIRHRRPAKVYRSRFDPILPMDNKKDDGYLTTLKSPLMYDVTNEYLSKTTDIRIGIDDKDAEKNPSGQVYLCVYNHYSWLPIALGSRIDTVCHFKQVVGDNIFMVADCTNRKELRFITAPFYLDSIGNVRKFIPDMDHPQAYTMKKRSNALNQKHTLYYWNVGEKRFTSVQYASATDTFHVYDRIPGNALLWFTIPERVFNQRIFFLENGEMKRY